MSQYWICLVNAGPPLVGHLRCTQLVILCQLQRADQRHHRWPVDLAHLEHHCRAFCLGQGYLHLNQVSC